ncbi:MAG: hypothetical protein OXC69_04340 [Candidatus Tectomicrobia bacterium]|nr:hypothetical protein [Candidatus Tectomicrobia bacterium]
MKFMLLLLMAMRIAGCAVQAADAAGCEQRVSPSLGFVDLQ